MKWPYTVNVGGVTFYSPEHLASVHSSAYIDGLVLGLIIGAAFVGSIWWFHG